MTEAIKGIIAQLEHQKAAIDRALAALREVEGVCGTEPKTEPPSDRGEDRIDCGLEEGCAQEGHDNPGRPAETSRGDEEALAVRRSISVAGHLQLVVLQEPPSAGSGCVAWLGCG